MKQCINSLLENDSYKFGMGQCIYHQFPSYMTTWTFNCRNTNVYFTEEMVKEIKNQIKLYCDLRFTEEELDYLKSIKWLKHNYVDFLRLWHPRYEDFTILHSGEKGLTIEVKGSWLNTSMYEVPTLAIVNEVYFRMAYHYDRLKEAFIQNLAIKIKKLVTNEITIGNFSEFGMRRRLSSETQDLLVDALSELKNYTNFNFVGTSNVYLAKKYNLTPVGTMAHELNMAIGQGNRKH